LRHYKRGISSGVRLLHGFSRGAPATKSAFLLSFRTFGTGSS
jgi:hypothetical protein